MSKPRTDWTSVEAWANHLRSPWPEFCPFWDEPLTRDTRFLYSESTSPLPAAAYAGLYSACPNWRILAAQIRHAILPDCFGTYLCRREWDKSDIPLSVEGVLMGARAAEVVYCKEIPTMKHIIETVDKALCAPEEAVGWPLLEEACRIFNEEWRTGGWDFALRVFPSLEAVMRDVTGVDEDEIPVEDPDDPDDLGLLYQRCFEDPEANQMLRDYFRGFVRM